MILFKRHSFVTLLEVIIAMALTILVLTSLTFFYQEVYSMGKVLDTIQKDSFQKRFLESRLSYILTRAVSEKNGQKDFVFFTTPEEFGLTKSASLIFVFDNGDDIDKPFSNHVLARLFVDPQNRLMLAYWPSPKRWNGSHNPPMKKEVLMDNVEAIAFEFFIPPDKEVKSPTPEKETRNAKANKKDEHEKVEPEPKGDWRKDTWLQDYNQLPAMIKIYLTTVGSKEKTPYLFPFPNTTKPITYDQ